MPSNYQPITCLSTSWKLLSGITAVKLSRHKAKYMSQSQKGIGVNTRGAKHQLVVDRGVTQDCKIKLTNPLTTWIYYEKVYYY